MQEKNSAGGWQWLDKQSELEQFISDLTAIPEIALDTEFHRERTYFPKLALLQVAWNERIVLLDPFTLDLRPLSRLFRSNTTVVLHAGTQDLDILARYVGELPRQIFDTQLSAGFIGFSNPSLALLSERLLGISVAKGDRLTDWTRRPLTTAQLNYAASDVANLLYLKQIVVDRLVEMSRLGWALDESKVLLEKDRTNVPSQRAWWKIKECRHLKGDSRKAAQKLAQWREERAARLDVPARYILSDLAVAAISQDLPRTVDAISTLRGVEPRFLGQGVDREILRVVSDGMKMADEDLAIPFPDDSDRKLRPIASLATIWITQLAQTLKVDSLLLATRADVSSYLNGDATSRLAGGWRNAVLGDAITKLAKGELALAVNADGELELEERSFRPFGAPE